METNWSQFSLSYTCLILLGVVLVMTAPRDTGYILRVNAFGVLFVMIFLLFVFSNGIQSMTSTEFVFSKQDYEAATQNPSAPYTALIPLFGASFMPLTGILGGGFYFHNMSLTMLSKAKEP